MFIIQNHPKTQCAGSQTTSAFATGGGASTIYFSTTRVVGTNGSSYTIPGSAMRADRFVPINFDAGAAITWDGVSALALEFSSCVRSAAFAQTGTVMKVRACVQSKHSHPNK